MSASSTDETTAVAPVASTSATWSGLRTTEVDLVAGLDEQGSEQEGHLAVAAEDRDAHGVDASAATVARCRRPPTAVTIGEREVRKEFVADHEAEAEREWACLTLLAEHAPGLAPRPLRREDGATPVIVMERLPGEPLAPRPLTAAQTEALGAALRRLYDVPVEAVTDAGIGPRRYGAAEHAQLMVEWLADDHDLRGCRDPGLVGEALERRAGLRRRPAGAGAAPDRARDRRPQPGQRALGRAACRLVDFEDGGLSDPAYELADHVEHLGSRLPGVYDARALADAVGLDAEDRERMAAYRPCGRRSGWRCSCRATARGAATRRARPRPRPRISWLSWATTRLARRRRRPAAGAHSLTSRQL